MATDLETIEYRKVTHGDVGLVYEFLEPFMASGFLLRRDRDELSRLMVYCFGAFSGEQIVGFAAVEIYSKKLAELQCLAVNPGFRRMGIGKSLVSYCCDVAKQVGVKELMAISASDEMFKACGFDYSLPNQKKALFSSASE